MSENSKRISIIIAIVVVFIVGVVAFGNHKQENKKDNKKTPAKTEEQEVKTKDFDLSKFDSTKLLNKNISCKLTYNLDTPSMVENSSKLGLEILLNADKKSATMDIDWSKYSSIYGKAVGDNSIKSYKISLDNKISGVYVAGFGQAAGYETALYLMKDGTIEYTPIRTAFDKNSNELKSFGKLSDVTGVTQIVLANSSCVDGNDNGVAVLGIRKDGKFYDLSLLLLETDFYK